MNQTLVIIPAYNEEETIREVVTRSLQYADVSVTDDGSRDATPAILKEILLECEKGIHSHTLHVITHERSTHIPRGVQDGLRFGVSRPYEFFITMDAGLSHDPDALPEFINADRSCDVVIGSRRVVRGVPLYRRMISRMAALVMNYALTDSYFRIRKPALFDTTSGFRRYGREAATAIASAELESKAFDFHMEALAIAVRMGCGKILEIPITYIFSNSSFNSKVLKLAARFALRLIATKGGKREVPGDSIKSTGSES